MNGTEGVSERREGRARAREEGQFITARSVEFASFPVSAVGRHLRAIGTFKSSIWQIGRANGNKSCGHLECRNE